MAKRRGPRPNLNRAAPTFAWDRQQGESALAWRAFIAYRDQGANRRVSSLKVRKRDGSYVTLGMLNNWSKTNRWRNRAAVWDQHVQRRADGAYLNTLKRMHVRHARTAADALFVLSAPLRELMRRAKQGKLLKLVRQQRTDTLVKMLRTLARDLRTLAEVERLARGEATTKASVVFEPNALLSRDSLEAALHADPAALDALATLTGGVLDAAAHD